MKLFLWLDASEMRLVSWKLEEKLSLSGSEQQSTQFGVCMDRSIDVESSDDCIGFVHGERECHVRKCSHVSNSMESIHQLGLCNVDFYFGERLGVIIVGVHS